MYQSTVASRERMIHQTTAPQDSLHPGATVTDSQTDCRSDFLSAMSHRVSSVNLVSTNGIAGLYGLTVTSMCSVSAEPPMVMIGINRKSPLCEAITQNHCFVINVLSVGQQHLADCFAGFGPEGSVYDFSRASWQSGVTGSPILDNAAAFFECTVASYRDVGSHRMFIGNVLRAHPGSEPALCYSQRNYQCAQSLV